MTDRNYTERRFMKLRSFFMFCALLVVAGTPSLNHWDNSGLVRGVDEFGLLNATNLWRLGVFVFVGAGVVLFFLFSFMRKLQGIPPIKGLELTWLFYSWLALSIFFGSPNFMDFAIAYYRLLEWGVMLLITQFLLSGPSHAISRIFERFMRIAPLFALGVLASVWLYNPILPYSYSLETQTFRLGGTAMHPNGLAILLGLGALYWSATGRGSFRYLVAGVLFLGCLLTWSRSGIVSVSLAFIIYGLLRGLIHRQASTITVFAVLAASSTVFVVFVVNFEALFTLGLRGERLDYVLNYAGRADVWMATLELLRQSPIFGHGFIVGPKQLFFSPYIPSHWVAGHAHNDFLNSMLAGGSVSGLLLLAIYFQTVRQCFRQINLNPLFIATFISLLTASLFETGLSNAVSIRGVLFIMLLRTATMINSYQLRQSAPEK